MYTVNNRANLFHKHCLTVTIFATPILHRSTTWPQAILPVVHGYQQEKPLVQHIRLLNAARKKAIEYSPDFLTTQVRARSLFHHYFFALNLDVYEVSSVQDHSMVIFKPPMLVLFANVGTEGSRGVTKLMRSYHRTSRLWMSSFVPGSWRTRRGVCWLQACTEFRRSSCPRCRCDRGGRGLP